MYVTTWRLWIFLRWATYPQSQRMFNAVRKCKILIQLEKRGIICSKPLYTWCLWRGLERLRVSASCRARGTRNSPKQIFRHKVRYIWGATYATISICFKSDRGLEDSDTVFMIYSYLVCSFLCLILLCRHWHYRQVTNRQKKSVCHRDSSMSKVFNYLINW